MTPDHVQARAQTPDRDAVMAVAMSCLCLRFMCDYLLNIREYFANYKAGLL